MLQPVYTNVSGYFPCKRAITGMHIIFNKKNTIFLFLKLNYVSLNQILLLIKWHKLCLSVHTFLFLSSSYNSFWDIFFYSYHLVASSAIDRVVCHFPFFTWKYLQHLFSFTFFKKIVVTFNRFQIVVLIFPSNLDKLADRLQKSISAAIFIFNCHFIVHVFARKNKILSIIVW